MATNDELWGKAGLLGLPGQALEPYQHHKEDVLASGMRAVFFAFLAGVGTWLFGCFLAAIWVRGRWLGWHPLEVLGGAFALGFLVMALVLFKLLWLEQTMYAAERWLHIDLTRDGFYGRPPEEPAHVPIVVNGRPIEDKSPRERFEAFVRLAHTDPTERHLQRWFNDRDITTYRDVLIAARLAHWNSTDKRHGWALDYDVAEILAECTYAQDEPAGALLVPSPTKK